ENSCPSLSPIGPPPARTRPGRAGRGLLLRGLSVGRGAVGVPGDGADQLAGQDLRGEAELLQDRLARGVAEELLLDAEGADRQVEVAVGGRAGDPAGARGAPAAGA